MNPRTAEAVPGSVFRQTPSPAPREERGLPVPVERGVRLAPFTSMRIGGPVEYLGRPGSAEEVAALLEWARVKGMPVRILGRGTNLLVDDAGLEGLVVAVGPGGLDRVEVEGTRIRAGAGARLARVVAAAIRGGLAGLEGLVGVPGSVGGAVRMNAGTRAGGIGAVTAAVTVVDGVGRLRRLARDEVGFGYRTTSLAGGVVVEAEFDLRPADRATLRRHAAALQRRRRATQPLGEPSAGCVFRNLPDLPAGRLIEEAGLKGRRIGGMQVSGKHANFMVNLGGGTFDDARRLIDCVREAVAREFGVELELEVEIWREGGLQAGTP